MGKVVVGVVLLVLGFMMFSSHPLLAIMMFLGLFIWIVQSLSNRGIRANSDFSDGYKHFFIKGRTAIAISPEKRIIKLKEKSKQKEYPFDMIRSWESNLQTGGMRHGTGIAANAGANIAQSISNAKASGFFVYIKDIDNPEWRIAMFNPRDQSKWMEIMRQCVNES